MLRTDIGRTLFFVDGQVFDDNSFRHEFARDRRDAIVGLQETGRKVIKFNWTPEAINFAAGISGKGDLAADMLRIGIMTEIDRAFRPAREVANLRALATYLSTTEETTRLATMLGGNGDFTLGFPRVSTRFVSDTVQCVTKDYTLTYDLERKAIEDDKSGLLELRARAIATNVFNAKERQLILGPDGEAAYVRMGTDTHWLDGQYVVDDDHSYSSLGGYATSQDNKSTGAPTAANILAAIEAMMAFKDFDGYGVGVKPDTVMYGPKYFSALGEAFNSPFYHHSAGSEATGSKGTGANQLYQFFPNLIVSSHLTGTYDDYAFLVASQPIAPIIVCERSDVPEEFTFRFDPQTSDEVYRADTLSVGYRGRWGRCYGPWHNVYGLIS